MARCLLLLVLLSCGGYYLAKDPSARLSAQKYPEILCVLCALLVAVLFVRPSFSRGPAPEPKLAPKPAKALEPKEAIDPKGDGRRTRCLGRGVSVYMPHAEKQRDLLQSWAQNETLALLGSGSYLLKQPGKLVWWDLPEEMLGHINKDQSSSVVYAALGPEEQYFLRFSDGDTCWRTWMELSEHIKQQEQNGFGVCFLCIAPKCGYFVLFDNGGWAYNRLPDSLRLFLKENKDRLNQIATMSVSQEGAWFVSFKDGHKPRWCCDHLPRRLSERLLQLSGGDWKIQSVEFGFDGSWLLSFDH
ncbi:unnamed protein product [Effrenium voratum]|nr:unnamed protein product [Effrenium voratum]